MKSSSGTVWCFPCAYHTSGSEELSTKSQSVPCPSKERKETHMKQVVPSPGGAALAGAALVPAAEGAAGAAGARSQRIQY